MRFLIDKHTASVLEALREFPDLVEGQFCTPLTYSPPKENVTWALDNGFYTRRSVDAWVRMMQRFSFAKERCLFTAVPDTVGSHKATLRMWAGLRDLAEGWPLAFVAQDGFDALPDGARALFLGGTDAFKLSRYAFDVVEHYSRHVHVHVGRVNTAQRFLTFHEAGAHTCDGSGVSVYWARVLPRIRAGVSSAGTRKPLFRR